MKEMMRYGFILSFICIIASASLAAVNAFTKNKIISQAKAEEETSLKDVFPEGNRFEPVKSGDQINYYKAYDSNNKFVGAVFKASGKGYSSLIETMVGMYKNGVISAIKVISQNETPGLGAQVTESSFTENFLNKNTTDLSSVEAITGATISSKAVINSITTKAEEIKGLIKNEN
jgi:electron transport complex protein RnfG